MKREINKKELIEFEKEIAEKWNNYKIPYPIHLSGGNEDELIEIFKEIKTDPFLSKHPSTFFLGAWDGYWLSFYDF